VDIQVGPLAAAQRQRFQEAAPVALIQQADRADGVAALPAPQRRGTLDQQPLSRRTTLFGDCCT